MLDSADADDFHTPLCPTLWRPNGSTCATVPSMEPVLFRVVSSPAVLIRRRLARCRTLTVPWPAHARTAIVARQARKRPIRIAFAGSIGGHIMANRLGFVHWRQRLRDACNGLKNRSSCTYLFQSLGGGAARSAIELYARSTFCLQPPGDTIVRTGIVDALSVGCIPVLFHPAQSALWPHFWRSPRMLFDWKELKAPSAENASDVLQTLLALPDQRVSDLQRDVASAARRTFYRGERGSANESDAVDVFVDVMLNLAHARARS